MNKKLFFLGLIGLLFFEILNVYFIMPMPGSQKMGSIDMAYFLYTWRWIFRILFSIMILYGLIKSGWKYRRFPLALTGLLILAVYFLNFKMAADHMFHEPKKLTMVTSASNKVDPQRLVIGVVSDGMSKAYPIQYLGFHHQVADTLAGHPILVTYCTVCRSGRVFEPIVNGRYEKFRLVGMDHFNAMFEDASTHSWWRQATGEAIAGKLKGQKLNEVLSSQTSLEEWLRLNPNSLVMQADPAYADSYDSTFKYESGKSKGKLTGTDSLPWKNKSWVVAVRSGSSSKAYDWNQLKTKRMIRDKIENTFVLIVLGSDEQSFFAFDVPSNDDKASLQNDTLFYNTIAYRLDGSGIGTDRQLKRLPVYQEFWHSWHTFHPGVMGH
ncbi:MAG: DUF3179 domain-containing (seleno)protein [Ginsengibacter sp.]